MIVLITGPVRSGKSARALQVARGLGDPVTYVATARVDPADGEMCDRVARHRADRGAMPSLEVWAPDGPGLSAIVAAASPHSTLLIDSLGTWIAGCLLGLEDAVERDPAAVLRELETFAADLIDGLTATRANVVLVGEETGWGIVPMSPLGRLFRDHLGRTAQRIAGSADRVELVVAGYALDVKALGTPVGK